MAADTARETEAGEWANALAKDMVNEALVTVAGQSSKAMADQIMAADESRLKSLLGSVSKADMQAVEDAIRVHLGLAK